MHAMIRFQKIYAGSAETAIHIKHVKTTHTMCYSYLHGGRMCFYLLWYMYFKKHSMRSLSICDTVFILLVVEIYHCIFMSESMPYEKRIYN